MVEKRNKSKEEQKQIVENTKKAQKDIFLEYAPYLIIIFFVVIIRIFIATPVMVNGSSMYPTLRNKDTMILYKLTKRVRGIKRFDIVVISTDSGKLIKRVIGLPKDHIRYEVSENDEGDLIGTLFINQKVVDEDFIDEEAAASTCNGDIELCNEGIDVPENEYFVMGDNRKNSRDSRMIGTIPESEIMGTTKLVLFPLNRMGNVK